MEWYFRFWRYFFFAVVSCCWGLKYSVKSNLEKGVIWFTVSGYRPACGAGHMTSMVRNRAVSMYTHSAGRLHSHTLLRCCRVMESVVVTGSSTLTKIFKKMSHRNIEKPVESRKFITETPFPVGFAYVKLKNKTIHYRGHSM